MKQGAVIVFESTVYPGTTEEICGPILEEESGMQCGIDFTLGYSPERINPGDKEHTVTKIKKIVAGQDAHTLQTLVALYGDVIEAGIHAAPSIQVAEMAKAIENAQRDLNIAFVNEIAMLCDRIGIPSTAVLEAAGTKWNFLPFSPGLVGGHCIGVDPYYLVEKARQLNMDTKIITAGRSVNNGMGAFVAGQIQAALHDPAGKNILVLGITFKENVPDTRNSKVCDVVHALEEVGCTVEVEDPFFTETEITERGFVPGNLHNKTYDAIALLVPHKGYVHEPMETWINATKEGGLIYDLKAILDRTVIEEKSRLYRSL
jgi:UDP-N-acetyl-D-galactosamine dehydrogenase